METEALIIRTWDDLVFRNRNRQYGAYLIRKGYSRRVMLGAGISIALLAGFLIFSGLAQKVADVIPKPPLVDLTDGHQVLPAPDLKRERKVERTTPVRSNSENRTIQVVSTPVEDLPVVDSPVEPIDDTGDAVDGGGAVDGTGPSTQAVIPATTTNTGPVITAEIMPKYQGGNEAMMKFIIRHIKYPSAPKKLGIEGTVFVSFVVDGDGKVTNVQVLRGIHQKCDEEAVRVVSMLPGWIGGKQNGSPVSVKMVLPI